MNVLLYHPDKDAGEMIAFCLESQLPVTVQRFTAVKDAIDRILQDQPIHLIVAQKDKDAMSLFKYLATAGSMMPLVMIREDESDTVFEFPGIGILAQLKRSQIPDGLIPHIQPHMAEISRSAQDLEYCPIHAELLLRVVPLKADVYIRLSSIKFIKLFQAGATFTRANLDKIWSVKKIEYLYLRSAETADFIEKFKQDLQAQIEAAPAGDTQTLNKVASVQATVSELVHKVGFTAEVKEIAKSNVKLALKSIGSNPRLIDAMRSTLLNGNNYVAAHSTALAHVACSVASLMSWPSATTYQKLVQAALFHDISIHEPELARIGDAFELDDKKAALTDEQFQNVLNHTVVSARFLDDFEEIAQHVDGIIEQHHERPDGSGFPNGLIASQIAPLSAVFIVAHDLVTTVLAEGDAFQMGRFLSEHERVYKQSPFRNIWRALQDQWKNHLAA